MPMSQVTDVISLFEQSVKTSQGIVDIQDAMNIDIAPSKSVKPKK
jgi:hypothetical protein